MKHIDHLSELADIRAKIDQKSTYDVETGSLIASILRPISRLEFGLARAELQASLEAIKKFELTPEYRVLQGALCFSGGDRAGAYECFIRAVSKNQTPRGSFRGACCIEKWEPHPVWLSMRARRKILRGPLHWLGEAKHSDLTVLAAGDQVYFVRYAQALLDSVAGSSTPVHFHVVGWSRQCDEVINNFRHSSSVTVSRESYPFENDKTYFATVRFLRALELMRVLGSLFITDLDNTFTVWPELRKTEWQKYDVAIKANQWGRWLPWLMPPAGTIFIKDSPLGLQTASLMANYVDHRFVPSKSKWYFDQIMLNEVLEIAKPKSLTLTPKTLATRGRQVP